MVTVFDLLRKCHTIFQSGYTTFQSHQQHMRIPGFGNLCQHLLLPVFFILVLQLLKTFYHLCITRRLKMESQQSPTLLSPILIPSLIPNSLPFLLFWCLPQISWFTQYCFLFFHFLLWRLSCTYKSTVVQPTTMSTSPVTTSVNHDDSDQLIFCFFNLDFGYWFPYWKGRVYPIYTTPYEFFIINCFYIFYFLCNFE